MSIFSGQMCVSSFEDAPFGFKGKPKGTRNRVQPEGDAQMLAFPRSLSPHGQVLPVAVGLALWCESGQLSSGYLARHRVFCVNRWVVDGAGGGLGWLGWCRGWVKPKRRFLSHLDVFSWAPCQLNQPRKQSWLESARGWPASGSHLGADSSPC